MSEEETLTVQSTRFGEVVVDRSSIIEIPSGLIGFPKYTRFVMIDHKPPFSWLQSIDEPALAFVVVDGFEIGSQYDAQLPFSYSECDFKADDEYAVLIVVTIRPDPRDTTANLKAPLFINVRNRRGVQVIYDDAKYSTRHPLWNEAEQKSQDTAQSSGK